MRQNLQRLGLKFFKPSMKKKSFLIMIALSLISFNSAYSQTVVNSLADLITALELSDQTIVMEAGNYNMEDLESNMRNIHCSGSNNSVDLTGVYVEVPVGSTSTTYITVSGDNNTLIGGEFEDTYNSGITEVTDFSAYNQDRTNLAHGLGGAAVMDVTGDDNLIDGIKLTVRGSFPYGYGSMYGINNVNTFGLNKRCGLLVTGGVRNTINNVEIQQRAFGHGFFVQGDADETVVKNTLVEGRVRAYSELYNETNSYDFPYLTNYTLPLENYEPYPEGDVFSLCEDGIRMYSIPGSIEVENCTVKKMRGGIRLYLGGPATVTNTTAIDCGNTNWNMPASGVVTNSSGNFAYAPLSDFRLSRSNMDLEWTIIPSPHASGPHNLADVLGNNHTIVFHRTPGPLDSSTRPIVVTGSGSTITNETEYPMILESSSSNNTIISFGPVIDNGTNNTIEYIDGSYEASLAVEAEDYSDMSGVETTTTTDDDGGDKISFIDANDWVEYEIVISLSGTYSFDYRVAGAVDGDFEVGINDEVIDAITFDATGGDETWETIRSESPIYLTEGVKTIRVTSNVAGWNLNWIELLAECYDTPITPNVETVNTLGVVLADEETADVTAFPSVTINLSLDEETGGSWNWSGPNDFSSDERDVVLSDAQIIDSGDYVATFTNTCGQQTEEIFSVIVTESLVYEAEDFDQMSGVLTETTTDTGGGDNVNEINNGDWIEFEIDVPSTASFYIDYRVASAATGGSFTVSSEDIEIDNVSFDATGGVQTWETVTSSSLIALNTGTQTIRVSSTMDEWSLNWFELKLDQMVSACDLPFTHDDKVISGEVFNWSSGAIAITCEDSVSVFANISGIGTMDESDYLNIYYKLDDGELTAISEKVGTIDDEFVYVEDLNGQIIEIVIEGFTSNATKTYTISDLLMQYGSVMLSDKIEAEDYDGINTGAGIQIEDSSDEGAGSQLGFVSGGDWCMFRNIDMTNTPSVTARISSRNDSGTIEVRLGSATGTLIGSIPITTTGSWSTYTSYSTDLISTSGLQDVYFVFSASFNINWFQFSVDRTAMRDDEVRLVATVEKVLGDEDYDPGVFVVSGLPVTYTSSNLEVAVIIDGKVSIVGVGTSTITATSEGSDLYHQAEGTQILTVTEVVLSLEGVERKVNVYPNPTSNHLFVTIGNDQYTKLEMYDITGTRILRRDIDDHENSLNLNLENLSKGMYVIVLRGKQKIESHRVIKL